MGTDATSDSEPIAGRYTLDHVIGAGATAVVHQGRDLVTDQPVAVKVYRFNGAARYRLQHRREITALTQLRHPGLVALHDGGIEPGPKGRIYLVTELIEGPSLAERLLDGPLDVRAVRNLTARLAAALAYVHDRGFIHRDIKPANILLEHDQEPRLADFGIARAIDGTIATTTGAVAGTAAYLAPEQVRGAPVDPAADVYALGLVLLEALTGRREYPGTVIESATARLHRSPVVPPGLPWNLTTLLKSMTDPDPAGRSTAASVASALTTAHTDRAPATAVPAAPPRAEPPSASPSAGLSPRLHRPRKAPALVAAAAMLTFLLGGATVFITTARSNLPALPSIGAAPTPSNEDGGASSGPTSSSTSAIRPPAAVAAASVPLEVMHPDRVGPVASYTRTGQVPATNSRPSPTADTRTTSDRDLDAATEQTNTASTSNNGNGNGNGNGKATGNGKGKGAGKRGK